MAKKLNRRELVQAGVVTGAALALGGTMAARPSPAEGGDSAHIQGVQAVQATIYLHVPDSCISSWHNPACPGSAGLWQPGDAPSGTKYNCSHNI